MIGRRRTPSVGRQAPRKPIVIGVVGFLVLFGLAAMTFVKKVPFTHDHRVNALVSTSTGLRKGSPVRIAGVAIGRVTSLGRGPGDTRLVRMELKDEGLPVHRDATLRVRPRLFLEGGYYVDLAPGSPSAPQLAENATLPLPQTTAPVQFDQALGVLDSGGRNALKTVIGELDTGLDDGGAEAAAAAGRPLGDALRDGGVVARAARGPRPDDVAGIVAGASKVTAALASRARDLGGIVDATATTMQALAAEDAGLARTLSELDRVVRTVPGDLERIAATAPGAVEVLDATRPGLRQARTSLPRLTRTLRELQLAARPTELPGLLGDLRPTLATLPGLADRLRNLFPLVTAVTDCLRDRALPVLNAKLADDALSTGVPVWQEVVHFLPALAGASGSFDANGNWVRFLLGAGDSTVSSGDAPGPGTALSGTASEPVLGVRPSYLGPGRTPSFRPDEPCSRQRAPDLTARTSGGTPMASRRGVRAAPPVTRTGLIELMRRSDAQLVKGARR